MDSPHAPQPPDPRRERALQHPLRLRIIETLRERPASEEELAAELDVDVAVVAYHSHVLTRAGYLPVSPPASANGEGD